jgi:hypothetical protein
MTEFLVGSINLKVLAPQQGWPTTCLLTHRSLRRETTKSFRFKGCPSSNARTVKWITATAVVASLQVQSQNLCRARKNLSLQVEIQIRDLLKEVRNFGHPTRRSTDCNTCLFTIIWLNEVTNEAVVYLHAWEKKNSKKTCPRLILPSRLLYW